MKGLKLARIEILHGGFHLTQICQKLTFTNAKTALQYLHSNSIYLAKKSHRGDIIPMGYKLSCSAVVVFGLGKDL